MRLSRDKVNHMAKLIAEDLEKDDMIELFQTANETRLGIFKIMLDQFKIEDEIDGEVRRFLDSYSKKIIEGGQEWDVMYIKQFEEEVNKRKL